MTSERLGYLIASFMIIAQMVLMSFDAGFWALVVPGVIVAIGCAVGTFNNIQAGAAKPRFAYVTLTVFGAATVASFWFAPEEVPFKLQMARLAMLDLTLILLACVMAANMRRRMRAA